MLLQGRVARAASLEPTAHCNSKGSGFGLSSDKSCCVSFSFQVAICPALTRNLRVGRWPTLLPDHAFSACMRSSFKVFRERDGEMWEWPYMTLD